MWLGFLNSGQLQLSIFSDAIEFPLGHKKIVVGIQFWMEKFTLRGQSAPALPLQEWWFWNVFGCQTF